MSIAVALDFETADFKSDSACALAMVRIQNGVVQTKDVLYRLIRPPRSRVMFTHIHGLTWSMLKEESDFAAVWPQFFEFLKDADILVAHNAVFDRSILYGCCHAYGLKIPKISFACTLKGARKVLSLPHYRLNDVCAYLGINLHHHHAESDALAAAHIYVYLLSQRVTCHDMLLSTDKYRMRLSPCPEGKGNIH